MVELHFPAGHQHPAVLMMDLQLSDVRTEKTGAGTWTTSILFSCSAATTALNILPSGSAGPNDDDFVHYITSRLQKEKAVRTAPSFCLCL